MRGLVLFVGLLLIAISWAASVPATAEDCKGNCATVSIPDPVAASSDEKSILTQDCPGGVCLSHNPHLSLKNTNNREAYCLVCEIEYGNGGRLVDCFSVGGNNVLRLERTCYE
jgi:hypothetical protein